MHTTASSFCVYLPAPRSLAAPHLTSHPFLGPSCSSKPDENPNSVLSPCCPSTPAIRDRAPRNCCVVKLGFVPRRMATGLYRSEARVCAQAAERAERTASVAVPWSPAAGSEAGEEKERAAGGGRGAEVAAGLLKEGWGRAAGAGAGLGLPPNRLLSMPDFPGAEPGGSGAGAVWEAAGTGCGGVAWEGEPASEAEDAATPRPRLAIPAGSADESLGASQFPPPPRMRLPLSPFETASARSAASSARRATIADTTRNSPSAIPSVLSAPSAHATRSRAAEGNDHASDGRAGAKPSEARLRNVAYGSISSALKLLGAYGGVMSDAEAAMARCGAGAGGLREVGSGGRHVIPVSSQVSSMAAQTGSFAGLDKKLLPALGLE
ncbi:hypothetical protein DFJ74DRAFT_249193 [Hyaloraphidium curvatum]|nr:hypothetical protein DFJ74DRAFT_249193 [Hyaloraphidium curvatum]